jgi:hypothetical protein
VLRATIGGLNLTIKCSSTETVEPTIVNREPSAGKHTIEGTSTRTTYVGCHAMLKSKETRTCAVEEVTGLNPGMLGMISTNALEGATTGVERRLQRQQEYSRSSTS